MKLPNPDDYIKLFNIKESVFSCYPEIIQRESMTIDGYPNIELVYIDGQFFFLREDMNKYEYPDDEMHKALDLVKERGEAFELHSSKLNKDYSNATEEELDKGIAKVIDLWSTYVRTVDIPVYMSHFFEGKVLKMMYDVGFTGHDFDILTHPLNNIFHRRRKRDFALLKLGKLTKEEFYEKWKWSEMVLYQKKFVDEKFIEDQLNHIEDANTVIEELDSNHEKAKEEYDVLYSKLPEELKKKADLIQKFLYVRDYRFELAIRGGFTTLPLFDAVAKKRNISFNQLIFSSPPEILRKEVSTDVDKRIKGYVFYKGKIYVGEEMLEWKKHFNKKHKLNEIKGKGVSKGKVIGRAKIVMSADEAGKIEKGDIIVCDITTPDYMHALHTVSAIVANIGGFTSHSAIVAREFNIPCVVGTGNATNVFEDNEIIEVDADNGIVRKILDDK